MAPANDTDGDLPWSHRRPPDWTCSNERAAWMLALRDRIADLFDEPQARLQGSRAKENKAAAARMRDHKAKIDRLFVVAGMPSADWQRAAVPPRPPLLAAPPPLTEDSLGQGSDVYASWPPLAWDSPSDLERWYWRLDGLCEQLASLAIHAYPDRAGEDRLRVEHVTTRLRSHLVRARRRFDLPDDIAHLEQVPPLAFWSWPHPKPPERWIPPNEAR